MNQKSVNKKKLNLKDLAVFYLGSNIIFKNKTKKKIKCPMNTHRRTKKKNNQMQPNQQNIIYNARRIKELYFFTCFFFFAER